MSALYEIHFEGEKHGPLSLQQLADLHQRGELPDDTQIRPVTVEALPWATWGKFRERNGKLIADAARMTEPSWISQSFVVEQPISEKSRGTFIILAILLGTLGAHNFYAGRYPIGFFQFSTTAILAALLGGWGAILVGIWALVEAVTVTEDGQGAEMK